LFCLPLPLSLHPMQLISYVFKNVIHEILFIFGDINFICVFHTKKPFGLTKGDIFYILIKRPRKHLLICLYTWTFSFYFLFLFLIRAPHKIAQIVIFLVVWLVCENTKNKNHWECKRLWGHDPIFRASPVCCLFSYPNAYPLTVLNLCNFLNKVHFDFNKSIILCTRDWKI
jgi:hypothetical protein